MNRVLAIAALSAVLTACGGGGGGHGDDGNAVATPLPRPAAQQDGDSFFASLLNLINRTDETSEPVSPEGFAATSPENTEPVPTS